MHRKNNLPVLIMTIAFFASSCSSRYLPSYHPVISIDSVFVSESPFQIDASHALRLTNAVATINEKYQKLLGYSFARNYQRRKKKHSDFVIRGKVGYGFTDIGFGLSQQKDYYFLYSYTDTKSNYSYGLQGVARGPTKNGSFRYDSISGGTNFDAFKWDLNTGFLGLFIPSNKVLKPDYSAIPGLKSFSIDQYVQSNNEEDQIVAKTITNLANNILVYSNRLNKGKRHTTALCGYNYYPNYLRKIKNRVKADYTIGGRLIKLDSGTYKLILEYNGEHLNLTTPDRIVTEMEFSADDVNKGDYSTFILSATSKIRGFVWQQILID